MYPSGHSFFTAKYGILQLYPNEYSFFFCFFLQWNTKFYSYTQTAIRFLYRNTKYSILCHLFFDCEIFKVIPKRSFAFCQQMKISKVVSKLPLVFLTTKYKIWSGTQTQRKKNLINYFFSELLIIRKKPTKLLANLSLFIFCSSVNFTALVFWSLTKFPNSYCKTIPDNWCEVKPTSV